MFNDVANALLAFDGVNKRLYVYAESGQMTSYLLDGSDPMNIELDNVETFAVDGRSNVIYYHHELQSRIRIYNMTSNEDFAKDGLSDVESVKDLDIDFMNG